MTSCFPADWYPAGLSNCPTSSEEYMDDTRKAFAKNTSCDKWKWLHEPDRSFCPSLLGTWMFLIRNKSTSFFLKKNCEWAKNALLQAVNTAYNVCRLSNLTDNLHIYGMLIPSSCIYLYMKAVQSGTLKDKVGTVSYSDYFKRHSQ